MRLFKYISALLHYQYMLKLSRYFYTPFEVRTVYLYVISSKNNHHTTEYIKKILRYFEKTRPSVQAFLYAYGKTMRPKTLLKIGIAASKDKSQFNQHIAANHEIIFVPIIYRHFK